MPNTLAHLGAQGLASRGLLGPADLRWVLLGCVLPDVPWILHRLDLLLLPGFDPYALRLYAIAQASLLCCWVLAAGLCLFSSIPRRAFAVLALGSLLHLVLDALQTKWGNGVHLFAPLSWKLWNAGLFWPEAPMTLALTAFGLGYGLWAVARRPGPRDAVHWPGARRGAVALGLLALYLALPALLRAGPEAEDNHFVRTLRARESRTGREVEFDRASYVRHESGDRLRFFAGEELALVGPTPARSGSVSVRGRFLDPDTLEVLELHDHSGFPRDAAAGVGLLLVAAAWILPAHREG